MTWVPFKVLLECFDLEQATRRASIYNARIEAENKGDRFRAIARETGREFFRAEVWLYKSR